MTSSKRSATSKSSSAASNALNLSANRSLPRALELRVFEFVSADGMSRLLHVSHDMHDLVHIYLRSAAALDFSWRQNSIDGDFDFAPPSATQRRQRAQLAQAGLSVSRRCQKLVVSDGLFAQKPAVLQFLSANETTLRHVELSGPTEHRVDFYQALASCRELRVCDLAALRSNESNDDKQQEAEDTALKSIIQNCKHLETFELADFPPDVFNALLSSGRLSCLPC